MTAERASLRGLRVLVVAGYYAPETTGSAPYTTGLAEHLAAQGAVVTVVTTDAHYPHWRRFDTTTRWWTRSIRAGVSIWRVPAFIPARPTLAARAIFEATFALSALGIALACRPDVVIGTSPNLGSAVVARVRRSARSRPAIQVVQDIVSVGLAQAGDGRRAAGHGLRLRAAIESVLVWLERWALANADAVIVPHAALADRLASAGVERSRMRVIANWSRLSTDSAADAPPLDRHAELIVLHTGNIGQKQALPEMADLFVAVEKALPNVRFVFVGDGNGRTELEQVARGTSNVEIRPLVPDGEYLALLQKAHVLLLHEGARLKDMSVASKLTSYFAAGRPVLAITGADTPSAREVRRSDAGVVVAHDNAAAVVTFLTRLVDEPELGRGLGRAGMTYCAESLGPRRALREYEAVLENVLSPVDHRGSDHA